MKTKTLVIGGVETNLIYSKDENKKAIFILHGRMQDQTSFYNSHSEFINKVAESHLVIMFDHRNHGKRMVDPLQNEGIKKNENHAIDMYSIMYGTSCDVAFLIDFIGLYYDIQEYCVIGYSLGGHSSYFCGMNPKIDRFVSIVGCGDYAALMKNRGISLTKELELISREKDPLFHHELYRNKKMLFLYGKQDTLVPRKCNLNFMLKMQDFDVTEFEDEDAKHEFSKAMKDKILQWI
jgi:hypothetical protein